MSKRLFAANRARRREAQPPPATSLAAAGRQHPTRKPPREHQPTLMSLTMIAGRVNRDRIAGTRTNEITDQSAEPGRRAVGLRVPTSTIGSETAGAATALPLREPIAPPGVAEAQQTHQHRHLMEPPERPGRHERADHHAKVLSAVKIPHGSRRRRLRDLVIAGGLAAAVVGGIVVTTSWIARTDPPTTAAPMVSDNDQSAILPSFVGAVPPDVSSSGSQGPAILIWDPETAVPAGAVTGIVEPAPGSDPGDLSPTDPGAHGFGQTPDQQSRDESSGSSRPAGPVFVGPNGRESQTPASSQDEAQPTAGDGPAGSSSDPMTSPEPTVQTSPPQTSPPQTSADPTPPQTPPDTPTPTQSPTPTESTSDSPSSSASTTSQTCASTTEPATTETITNSTGPIPTGPSSPPTDQPPVC